MKDGLASAEMAATLLSGTTLNVITASGANIIGTSVVSGASMTGSLNGQVGIRLTGSVWAAGAGSFGGIVTAGSFTAG